MVYNMTPDDKMKRIRIDRFRAPRSEVGEVRERQNGEIGNETVKRVIRPFRDSLVLMKPLA